MRAKFSRPENRRKTAWLSGIRPGAVRSPSAVSTIQQEEETGDQAGVRRRVARQSGSRAATRPRPSTRSSTRSPTRSRAAETVNFTGFGKFATQRARPAGRQPAEPGREGPHPGRDRAEVLGGQPLKQAVKGGEALASPSDQGRLASAALALSTALCAVSGRPITLSDGGDASRRRPSPTASPRRSSASAASSSSASTRGSTCSRVELRGDAHVGRPAAAEATARFCCGIIDAVAPHVVAVKPQLAFFEALGSDGHRGVRATSCAYARTAGLLVIVDGKRGDIGSTARAYADAYLEPRDGEPPLADALTVNPYLGRDSLEPFLAACRRDGGGIFCLVKTSNAGGADVQDLDALRRPPALAPGRASSSRELGRGAGRRLRPLEHRRGRRRDATRARSARRGGCCRRRSCSCPASARRARRPPTSLARSRAARRARSSPLAFGHVRVPRRRGRLACGRRGRGRSAESRGVDGLRLVGQAGSWARRPGWPGGEHGRRVLLRYAAPAAFLLVVTGVALAARSGLRSEGRAGEGDSRPSSGPRRPRPPTRATPAPPKRWYVIQSGDTLGAIAARFGTTVDGLLASQPGGRCRPRSRRARSCASA